MNPEARSDHRPGIGAELASFLSARGDAITAECVAAFEHDPLIPISDNLTLVQLKDHLPSLFGNLNDTLQDAFDQNRKKEATETATKHGEHRWSEGYDLSELLREFAHVRTAFIAHLLEFEECHPDFGAAAKLFAQVTLHRFFDDAVRHSVEQFRAEQQLGEKQCSQRSPNP